jgi:hypothetical protein
VLHVAVLQPARAQRVPARVVAVGGRPAVPPPRVSRARAPLVLRQRRLRVALGHHRGRLGPSLEVAVQVAFENRISHVRFKGRVLPGLATATTLRIWAPSQKFRAALARAKKLKPFAFKLWVNTEFSLYSPLPRGAFRGTCCAGTAPASASAGGSRCSPPPPPTRSGTRSDPFVKAHLKTRFSLLRL